MKVLHTSDWHLGRSLYGRKRYAEHEAFLNWLCDTITREQVDLLLVAGDIFDTGTPSNRAQELYYRFLCRIASSLCRHVVLIAGNHDSPSFLNAPKQLLRVLDMHVIVAPSEDPHEQVLLLHSPDGSPQLIVGAVPYLRDRDVRLVEPGEDADDKRRKWIDGVRHHYADIAHAARKQRETHGGDIPIVVTGHLFSMGGKTVDGDGVRELAVGSLAHVPIDVFPDDADYIALGHLHVPQTVASNETIRYSGSPLPIGFGEATQNKSVCLIDFTEKPLTVTPIEVPVFQRLQRVSGDWEAIAAQLQKLRAEECAVWLEVVYDGEAHIADLRSRLEEAVEGSTLELIRIKNNRVARQVHDQSDYKQSLDQLSRHDVFERCLVARDIPEHQRAELRHTYQEALTALDEADPRAT